MKIPTLALLILTLLTIARAPNSSAQTLPPMCAAFTPDGQSLAATITETQIQLQITFPSGESLNLNLSTDESDPFQAKIRRDRDCQISISASGKNAAIDIKVVLLADRGVKTGLLIAPVDLQTKTWSNHPILVTAQDRHHPPHFAGFLQDSENQIVVNTADIFCEVATDIAVVTLPTGDITQSTLDTTECVTNYNNREVYVDARHALVWLLAKRQRLDIPSLKSISILNGQPGPTVSLLTWRSSWIKPDFSEGAPQLAAFSSSSRIVLANSSAWDLGFGPTHLWVADPDSHSLRFFDIPKDLRKTLLHGLGLGWYENVEGPIIFSPDGHFAVITIRLAAIGPPYLLDPDNYVVKGYRLTVVDLEHPRIVTSVESHDGHWPRALALDHRNGKVTLLVNWKDEWQRLQFPAEVGPS